MNLRKEPGSVMKGVNNDTRWLQTVIRCAAAGIALQTAAWGAPSFDIDLKELKKPSSIAPHAPKHVPVTKKKETGKELPAPTTQRAAADARQKTGKPAQPPAPKVLHPAELTLTAGSDPCQLAERIATAVARPVKPEQLLFGLPLQPRSAVATGGVSALILCDLPPAVAYTYSRLLAEHQVQTIAIQPTDTLQQVSATVLDNLAITYRLEPADPAHPAAVSYHIPSVSGQERPLRLTIQP